MLERLRKPTRAAEGPSATRLARRAGWAERRLLVIPADPAHLQVVVTAERAGSGRGDATIHQCQLEPPGDVACYDALGADG